MTLTDSLILLSVGAAVALIAERRVRRGLPYGWVGALVAGLIGVALMTDVLDIISAPALSLIGIPVMLASLGAMTGMFTFKMLSGGGGHGYRGARTYSPEVGCTAPLAATPVDLSVPKSLQRPSVTDRILADCSEDRYGGLRETIAAEVMAYTTEGS